MFKIIKNKKLRVFIIVLLCLVLFLAIVTFVINILKRNFRTFYKVSDELVLEEFYNIGLNEIDIKTKMSDIYIKESLNNNVEIVIYGEKDYININQKNNKLFINTKEKNFIAFDFYKCISVIELYIPKGYNNLIRIDSQYGNIQIEEFLESKLYVEQKYGDVSVLGVDFIRIYNDYGNIDLNKATKARIHALSGNINVGTVSDIEIENEYGNINIDSIDEYFKLNNESGSIKLNNIVLEKDSFIDIKYGNIEIGTTNDIYINAKTDHGKINIKNNNKGSDTILKIHNKSGDININN